MRAHILKHVPFEGPGSIRGWLESREAVIGTTCMYLHEKLPEVSSMDLLVVMGGPMSINDEYAYPWLAAEKRFLRDVIAAGIPVLGVCLGAQLIASALGAGVYANGCKEIGWFPVHGVHNDGPVFKFPSECSVLHWHGETFDLPAGAVRLAGSAACRNQAFQYAGHVIGLQFHLETTPESLAEMVEKCRHELVPAHFVQSESDLLAAPDSRFQSINKLMGEVLAYLLA